MKIHCFYLHMERIECDKFLAIGDESEIIAHENFEVFFYAYTPDENSASFFRKTRNMKLFYEKIVYMKRNEYTDFYDEYPEKCIEEHSFVTKTIEDGYYKKTDVRLLVPTIEADIIQDYSGMLFEEFAVERVLGGYNSRFLNCKASIFKKKIVQDIFTAFEENYETGYYNLMRPDYMDFDLYALYIRVFSNTLKG